MTPRQWLALFCFYISYLFLGASVFYHIEHGLEIEQRAIDLQHRIDVNELLVKYTSPNDTLIQAAILRRVSDYCGKPVTNYKADKFVEPMRWSFYHAFFFAFTVCSTVGYGNISPSNTTGQMFMIFYALIGIPVNGFLFAYLGDFFGKVFLSAYDRYKKYKISTTKNYAPIRMNLIGQILLYLIPGVVVFIFLPSLIFSYFENWTYSASLYYSFVTLTTIGFGDFVPTFNAEQEKNYGIMFHVYEVFIIFWFIFGLGYLVMIMSFIAKGLRSKHLTRLEHQLAENIKSTQSRIWNGVTKDVNYLRRVLNEVYVMTFKPVYADEEEEEYSVGRRSSSCPDLSIYRPASDPLHRRRAQSLFYPENDPELMSISATVHRAQSENDLSRIDRKRSFDPTNQLSQPGELLARVVNALGNIRPTEEDAQSILDIGMQGGLNIFGDSEILASEKIGSAWSLPFSDNGFAVPPLRRRTRAASEFRPPSTTHLQVPDEDMHKWTWNGNNSQIQEFMRLRQMGKKRSQDLYRTALGLPKANPQVVVNIEPPAEAISPALSSPNSLLNRLNPFRRRAISEHKPEASHLDVPQSMPFDRDATGRHSRTSISPNQYLNATARGRSSNFSIMSTVDLGDADVLERTTIADLIRALEVVHTKVNAPDVPLLQEFFEAPKRKMGTASFSAQQNSNIATQPLPTINISPPTNESIRRNSLRPQSTQTPMVNRAMMARRRSNILDNLPSARRSSLLHPREQPPPYTEAPSRIVNRRFSVRPTHLSIPPGQAPLPGTQFFQPSSTTLQRRLSTRPSPLTIDVNDPRTTTGRYMRSVSTGSGGDDNATTEPQPTPYLTVGTPAARRRNLYLRAALNNEAATSQGRRGSRSQIYEPRNDRQRSESK